MSENQLRNELMKYFNDADMGLLAHLLQSAKNYNQSVSTELKKALDKGLDSLENEKNYTNNEVKDIISKNFSHLRK